MTRNRFNQAKHESTSTNNIKLSRARKLFLEDNDNIDMKNTYTFTNVHHPIGRKDAVNKQTCDSNSLASSKKIDILIKNLTKPRKVEFDKITTKTLQLKKHKLMLN